jgi:Fe-S cluster assembly iron-binding protein IscA
MELIFRNIDAFEYISPNVIGAGIAEEKKKKKKAVEIFNNQLNEIITNDDNFFVRLFLVSTPSKAKKYSIKFDNIINEFDRTFMIGKLKIVIDRKDLFYFMGILIDYYSKDDKSGFVFFDISNLKVIDYYNSV